MKMSNYKKIGSVLVVIALLAVSAVARCYYLESDRISAELMTVQSELDSTKDELVTAQENFHIEANKALALSDELDKTIESMNEINQKLEVANNTISDLKDEQYRLVYIGDFKLTHYCTEKRAHICGTGTGLTATGTKVTAGRSVAVDPSVIPYGTKMYIEGYGWRIAEDCGGGVDGSHIDIAVETHSQALSMGRISGGVWILVKTNS